MIEQGSKGVFAMPTILADDILKSATTSSSSASNQTPFGRRANVEQNVPIPRSQHGGGHLTSAKTDRYPTSTHEMQKRCKDRGNHIGFKHRRPRRVVSFKSPPPPPPPPPAAAESRLQHAGRALLKSVSTVFLRTKGGRDEQNEQQQQQPPRQQKQVNFPDPKTVYPSLPKDDVSINSNELSRFPSFTNRSRYEQTYQDDGDEVEVEEDSRLDLFTVSPTRMLYTYNESHFSELTPSGYVREPIKFVEVESLPLFVTKYTNREEYYHYCQ